MRMSPGSQEVVNQFLFLFFVVHQNHMGTIPPPSRSHRIIRPRRMGLKSTVNWCGSRDLGVDFVFILLDTQRTCFQEKHGSWRVMNGSEKGKTSRIDGIDEPWTIGWRKRRPETTWGLP